MALSNLPQPDTTNDGKTSSRWMFLLWQYVLNWTGSSSSTIITDQVFSRKQIPVYPSLLASDAQNVLSVREFSPRQFVSYTSLNVVDAQNIIAMQVFGS